MHLLILRLPLLIARQARHPRAQRALRAARHPGAQIAQLALRFLALALTVLLDTLALEILGADQIAQNFFAAADRLVPTAFGPVGVILRYATGAGDRDGPELADGVGGVVLGGGVGFGL